MLIFAIIMILLTGIFFLLSLGAFVAFIFRPHQFSGLFGRFLFIFLICWGMLLLIKASGVPLQP